MDHIEHIEELPLYLGKEGGLEALDLLSAFFEKTEVSTEKPNIYSLKWDGAPAVVFGWDHRREAYFVATKSFWNTRDSQRKIFSKEDAYREYPEQKQLAEIMILCLEELPKLNIGEKTLQGDILFADVEGFQHETWGDKIIFTPNLISYAVDLDSSLGRDITNAKIGIAVHTEITSYPNPDSRDTYTVKPFEQSDALSRPSTIWMPNPIIPNISNTMSWTEAEKRRAIAIFGYMKNVVNYFPFTSKMSISKELIKVIKKHINLSIRNRFELNVDGVYAIIPQLYKNEGNRSRLQSEVRSNRDFLDNFYHWVELSKKLKQLLLKRLDVASISHVFYDNKKGEYRLTQPEGVVATAINSSTVKIVDRLGFSAMNLADDKGWLNARKA